MATPTRGTSVPAAGEQWSFGRHDHGATACLRCRHGCGRSGTIGGDAPPRDPPDHRGRRAAGRFHDRPERSSCRAAPLPGRLSRPPHRGGRRLRRRHRGGRAEGDRRSARGQGDRLRGHRSDPDDRTHEAVAKALGRDLAEDAAALRQIGAMVARMHAAGWVASPTPAPANRRMARMATGGRILDNRRGMAPPLAIELEAPSGRWLFVLPGVPREFEAVLEEVLIPGYFSDSRAPTVVESPLSRRHRGRLRRADAAAGAGVPRCCGRLLPSAAGWRPDHPAEGTGSRAGARRRAAARRAEAGTRRAGVPRRGSATQVADGAPALLDLEDDLRRCRLPEGGVEALALLGVRSRRERGDPGIGGRSRAGPPGRRCSARP